LLYPSFNARASISTLWVEDDTLEDILAEKDKHPAMYCYHPHGVLAFGFSLNGAVRAKAQDPPNFVPLEWTKMDSNVSGIQVCFATSTSATSDISSLLIAMRLFPAVAHCSAAMLSFPAAVTILPATPCYTQYCDKIMTDLLAQAAVLFNMPFTRIILNLWGCCVPATKKGMYSLFQKRIPFGILPGGSEEIVFHRAGEERVYIKHRAGFIKYVIVICATLC
jgi:hypothetical protein